MRSAIIVALVGAASAAPVTYDKGAQLGRQITEPLYNCPADFNLVGKTCERTTTEQPITQCDQGVLQGGQCLIAFAKIQKCPAGTIKSGKGCQTTQAVPVQQQCPAGFVDNGYTCETQEALPIVDLCEAGIRQGQQCVHAIQTQHQRETFCPDGFEQHAKGGCWKVETYDCTPPYQGKNGAAGFRGLVGVQGPRQAPANLARVNVIQQTCERKISAPPTARQFCPEGFEDTGAACVKKTFTTPIQKCSNGGSLDDCFTTKTAPKTKSCPNGYRQEKGQCITNIDVPLEEVCEQGQENGKECVQTQPPRVTCPNNLILQGNLCLGRETVAPQVTVTMTCTGKDCYNNH